MAFLAFTDMSYQVLIPLIHTTSIPVGRLGLSVSRFDPRASQTALLIYSFFLLHFSLLWILQRMSEKLHL
ncbi:hypothetical protein C8R41DRAFT_853259 [Lentinula lateritia]|uniref:Uncharacterized protein n=1 Tax=Lentinula lateritia TaxID=40482 RepID=A0ABQ8V2D9_9AGAR|nr:hypothetical protein C8R41DRAFT_853259 [Lentinula lateritia]